MLCQLPSSPIPNIPGISPLTLLIQPSPPSERFLPLVPYHRLLPLPYMLSLLNRKTCVSPAPLLSPSLTSFWKEQPAFVLHPPRAPCTCRALRLPAEGFQGLVILSRQPALQLLLNSEGATVPTHVPSPDLELLILPPPCVCLVWR